MVYKTGGAPGRRLTTTKYRLATLAAFIQDNSRVPTVEETKSLLGIENENTAKNYLKMIKAAIPDPSSTLGEIQKTLVKKLHSRLVDEEHPMGDSDMIKLLEFVFPKKSENKQTIEEVKVIGDEDAEELASYREILSGAEGSDTPPL